MKPFQGTAASSLKSSTTTPITAMEERDGGYYPGCRKDANCNCNICLASFNATLDLMPVSIQKSSLTKFSASRPNVECTPVTFSSSILSSPISNSCSKMDSPDLKSTARLDFYENKEKRKRVWCSSGSFLKFFMGLTLLFMVEIGFSWGVCRILRPALSADIVRKFGDRSRAVQDMSGRLRFLQNELKGFVDDGKVSNCSFMGSKWRINQDGLLNSRCVLYNSAMEEVSIWGWPLQTAGLLKTGYASRSFTVLSGRVTEWSDGMIGYTIQKPNSSWIHRKWDASVVHLDPNTWVLEYGRSSILDGSRLSSAVAEFFKHQMWRVMRRMNQELWLFSALKDRYSEYTAEDHVKVPT